MFQANFVTFTNTDILGRKPLEGKFLGNQNDGFTFVQFADGSGGLEKSMKDWVGNKTGRLYRAEILAAQEYLAAQVGKAMNAPIRDCYFTSPVTVIMPFINGTPANEQNETELPTNAQGTALKLFDYLVANADRRPKNWIITSDNRIVGIDHALCNFRPRFPNSDFVAEMWNNGLTLEGLERLRPRLAALVLDFTSLGMADKHENLMANFDRLFAAFQILNQVAIVVKDALTPPKGVQETAQRALEWLKEGRAGDGFTPVGRKRASDLAYGHPVSLDTLKRMKAYFDRHQPDQKAEGFQQGEDGYPSHGRVAWDAWGGDAGYSWAKSVVESSEVRKEEAGHEFHGNQHTGGIGGSGGEAPRQSDPNRNVVSADRNKVPSDRNATSTEKPKDEAAKPDETTKPTDVEPKGDEAQKVWAQDAAQQILDGEMPKIAPDELLDLFTHIGELPPEFQAVDATEIDAGQGPRGPLLGDEGVGGGVSRDAMPQINGEGQRREFIAELEKTLGVKTTEESVDPTTLSPYQKEMVAGNIAGIIKNNPTGIPDSQRILVSSDGIIIDGHHNWAAGVALHEGLDSHPNLPIFRIDLPAAKLIPLATAFGDKKGNARQGMQVVKSELRRLVKKAHGKNAYGATKSILEMISVSARKAHARKKVKKGATGDVPRYQGIQYENFTPKKDEQSWGYLGEGISVPKPIADNAADAMALHALDLRRNQQYESAQFAHQDAAQMYRDLAEKASGTQKEVWEAKAKEQDEAAKAENFTDVMGEGHSPSEINKGDVSGHPFHGNQYAQGQGGAEMPANVAAFARNLKEFYGAGGKVERIDNYEKMDEIQRQAQDLQRKPEYKKMDDRLKQGIRFLAEAGLHAKVGVNAMNSEINPTGVVSSHLFVARNQDGEMVSALNITTHSGGVRLGDLSGPEVPYAEIGYLGSTGTMPGAATALMEQALQLAADKGLTVSYETTSDSQPYHDKLGVQLLNNRGLRGFSPESAAEVAALPNPEPTIIKSEIIKGDLPGHVFHGNQHVEVASEGRTTSPRKPAAKKDAIAGLPKGWKMKSKDGSRIVLTSKNGNTAIFATKARGWKPSEKYSQIVLAAAERLTSGKTINFIAEADTGRNSLAYVNRYKPDVIGMGRYSTVKGCVDHQMEQFEKQVTNVALVGTDLSLTLMTMEKGSPERDALIGKMAELYDQKPRTEAEVEGIRASYATFATPEKVIETMMNHELGHSDFFAEGHKISEIYPALTEAAEAHRASLCENWASDREVGTVIPFTTPEIWAQTQESAARDIVSKTSSRYSGFDFGNGVIVPRADYVDYSVKEGAGSNTLRETPQSILRSLGVTQYGSTKLQETVAEARAFYSTPGLPKSALTNRLGEILGWDKTQKSATLSFVKAEDDSVPPTSANVYQDKDGNLIARVFDTVDTSGDGAITIVGEEVILSDGSVMSLDDYNASIPNP